MSFTNLKRECPVCSGTMVKTEKPIAPFGLVTKKLQDIRWYKPYQRHKNDVQVVYSNSNKIGTLSTSIDSKVNKIQSELESLPSRGKQSAPLPKQLFSHRFCPKSNCIGVASPPKISRPMHRLFEGGEPR